MQSADIAIIGAAGMGGGELLRYLLQHPAARIVQLISRSQAGRAVTEVHPHLTALAGMRFTEELELPSQSANEPFVIFCAMVHGELAGRYPELQAQLEQAASFRPIVLLDLSADFRLNDPSAWQQYYGIKHPCPQHLDDFVYGLPELNRSLLATASRIACPGCFATAANLCLLPIAGQLDGRYIAISAMTGSSGSGIQPSAGTHHPHRAHDLRAYNMLKHRHQAELEMLLSEHGSQSATVSFVPHSAPLVRGIFATVQIECESEVQARTLQSLYRPYYAAESFVDVLDDSPRVATLAGSNRAQLHALAAGRSLVVLCALDNLGKGMAGQAVQNMNIALGLPENSGLQAAAVYP